MKIQYFNQAAADPDDKLLADAKEWGYVPATCLLGGRGVSAAVKEERDPCLNCLCPRERCKGRPLKVVPGRSNAADLARTRFMLTGVDDDFPIPRR